ncbi:MAG: ATP-binding protein, partial [Bacillota bacterium]|nr:ATP-binding protein [Bacillota bacterium]
DEVGMLGDTLNFLGTELEQNINALTVEKTQLANILTSMEEGVISFDRDGRVIVLNPPAEELFDSDDKIISGESLPIKSDPLKKINLLVEQVINNTKGAEDEIMIDGNIYSLKIAPIKGADEILGAVAVISNITKEKKLDQMRKEFVANVSHELRTPLSFLQGYVEAILDGMAQTEAEKENYLKIILEETLRLRRLVNELLNITQMESGHLQLLKEPVNLQFLINGVQRKLAPLAAELNIDFSVQLPLNTLTVLIDNDKIEQALINLLDNAFRYTKEGKVNIEVIDGTDSVVVNVKDTGPGIPEKELPYIFERFYKIDKSRNRNSGGTGLGLAIVKNIIKSHGKDITVKSELGKGTEFTFELSKA